MKKEKSRPLGAELLYVSAAASLPVLTASSLNSVIVSLETIVYGAAVSIAISLGAWFALSAVVRNGSRSALYVILLIVWGFAFGYLVDLLLPGIPIGAGTSVTGPFLGSWTAITLLVAWNCYKGPIGRIRRGLRIAGFASIGACLIGLMSLAPTATGFDSSQILDIPLTTQDSIAFTEDADPTIKRDVYYIVPDRYASDAILDEYIGYDNTGFTDSLRTLGFYVAEASLANYLRTAHSLAATLNLTYLPGNAETHTQGTISYEPLFRAIHDNRVQSVLSRHGYLYYHLGSWWRGTRTSRVAAYDYMTEEEPWCVGLRREVLAHSAPGYLLAYLGREPCYSHEAQRMRVNQKFAMLDSIARIPAPTFTFAHFLIPHEPFVFSRNGDAVTREELLNKSWQELYAGQVEYFNDRLLAFIVSIRESSTVEPIIVIQADEGPFSYLNQLAVSYRDWCTAHPDSAVRKFGILSAFYLPDAAGHSDLHPRISPVNTFRTIFREYFGYQLPLLPEHHFISPVEGNIYRLRDVSSVLNESLGRVRGSVENSEAEPRLCPEVPLDSVRRGYTGIAVPFRDVPMETE